MTPADLAAIQKRCDAATPGEWFAKPAGAQAEGPTFFYDDRPGMRNDIEFIAHARQDIPALLAEVERLRGLVEAAYREALNGGPGWNHSDAKRQVDG